MKTLPIFLISALAAAAPAPAYAAWDEVGRVQVQGRGDRASERVRMGGAVERLRLTAEGGDIHCRSVLAEFGNGNNRQIFQGDLPRNRPTEVDLPGDRRNLRQLTFLCGTQNRRDAAIRVSADVGRYREDWRRNPDFSRLWGSAFNWTSEIVNNWRYLGSEEFRGRGDTENHFAGGRGHRIDALALKPMGADAICSRAVAHFRNGGDRQLDVNRGDLLRQGQYYKLDVPGGYRNLTSLSLRCRPLNNRRVNIQIFTSN